MEYINLIANDEIERSNRAAYAVWMLFFALALVFAPASFIIVEWNALWIGSGIVGIGTTLAAFLVIRGNLKGQGYVGRAVEAHLPEPPAEYVDADVTPVTPELSAPTLPALPALPAYDDAITYNSPSRVGESIPRNLLHGFDPRDLQFLCRLLANGFKFTESAMEKIVLPYSLEIMGKAEDGTPYARFMELCVRAGIVVGREGRKSGTLAIMDAGGMMRRLKEIPV